MPVTAMPHVEGVEHGYADVNGFRMHYAEAGRGDPVVLVHGWPQHWWAWRGIIPALAERHRVIVPDLRGYGWSEVTESGYDKAQFGADVLALLDVLGIERVSYAGHDWGAVAGYIVAIERPERIERLVAMGVPLPWRRKPPPPQLIATTVAYQSVLSAPGLGALATRNFMPERMLQAARTNGEFSDEELRMYTQRWKDGNRAHASVQTYRTFLTKEMPAQIRGAYADSRLTVPTLLVLGAREFLRRAVDEDAYRDHVDDLRVETVADSGHWLLDESPDEVARLLLDFFA